MVPVVQAPELADALCAGRVAHLAAEGVAGVGGIGDETVVLQQGHNLRDAVRLRVPWVDVEVPGHGSRVRLIGHQRSRSATRATVVPQSNSCSTRSEEHTSELQSLR